MYSSLQATLTKRNPESWPMCNRHRSQQFKEKRRSNFYTSALKIKIGRRRWKPWDFASLCSLSLPEKGKISVRRNLMTGVDKWLRRTLQAISRQIFIHLEASTPQKIKQVLESSILPNHPRLALHYKYFFLPPRPSVAHQIKRKTDKTSINRSIYSHCI